MLTNTQIPHCTCFVMKCLRCNNLSHYKLWTIRYRAALLAFLTQKLGVPALEVTWLSQSCSHLTHTPPPISQVVKTWHFQAAATISRMEASGVGAVRGQSHLSCQPNLQVCQEPPLPACQESLWKEAWYVYSTWHFFNKHSVNIAKRP